MNDTKTIPPILLAKIREQIERIEHLVALTPAESIEWQPAPDSLRVCELLGHLLECLAGFCAALQAVRPRELSHFSKLCDLKVNHCCGIEEAEERIREYRAFIEEGFLTLTDDDLARKIPTVFVKEGEAALTLILGNLEHLINHKHQLFFYLKLLGVRVSTADLYHLRKSEQ